VAVEEATLHFEAQQSHQYQAVSFGNYSGAEAVVEMQTAINELIFEMDVRRSGSQLLNDLGQGEIVRRDESDRFLLQ
jgi:hypothetical protein